MKLLTFIMRLFFLNVFIFVAFSPSLTKADSKPFKQIFAFGDSLLDVGNDPIITFSRTLPSGMVIPGLVIPPPTRYDRGRFSNGPNIVDYLIVKNGAFIKPSETAGNLKKDSISYAYGGSETGMENFTPGLFVVPGLIGQTLKFEADIQNIDIKMARALFVLWSGSNDYMNSLLMGIEPKPFQIVNNIVDSVERLTSLGAKKIVIINLPDLGAIPICQVYGICSLLTELTHVHNSLLAEHLAENKKIILFDAYSVVKKIMVEPENFGFSDNIGFGAATGCLFQPLITFSVENCSSVNFDTDKIYWDELHPTTKIHKILANNLEKILND